MLNKILQSMLHEQILQHIKLFLVSPVLLDDFPVLYLLILHLHFEVTYHLLLLLQLLFQIYAFLLQSLEVFHAQVLAVKLLSELIEELVEVTNAITASVLPFKISRVSREALLVYELVVTA